jgi:two-component system CheB/CheR fusion protein
MNTLRLLLLEHGPGDAELACNALRHYGYEADLTRATGIEDLHAALRRGADLIVADYSLVVDDGYALLEIARDLSPALPFIVLADARDEKGAIETLRRGATDYFLRECPYRLGPSVARALRAARERTDHERAEAELNRAKEIAEAASRAKDQFLATLSHELRTPLTPALASISALEEMQGMPDTAHLLIDIIRRNIELESHLIDDLLDLTRIAKGKLRLNIKPADIHLLVKHVIENCGADVEKKSLRIETALRATCEYVMADHARLQQIIWNLLSNAIKFTPPGGTITVRTRDDAAERLALEVSDDGIGIDASVLPRIFDAFEQGHDFAARRSEGLGLGLAITKALVDLHDGCLIATSDGIGQGSTFHLELPAARAAALPVEQRPRVARSRDDSGIRILIVDDHEDTRRVIQMLLERRGYTTLTAKSVGTALDVAASNNFDLLISDIGLPDGTGIDLLRALTADGRYVRAIALSGYGMEEDIRRSKAAGFFEHLTKPVSIKKLQDVIDELTEDMMRKKEEEKEEEVLEG